METTTNQKILYRLKNSPLFYQECEKVRKKCKEAPEAEIVRDEGTGKVRIKNFLLVDSLFINEPYRIANEFKLPSEWVHSIYNHIITGEPLQVPQEQFYYVFDKKLKRWELYTTLHKKETQSSSQRKIDESKKFRQALNEMDSIKIDESDIYMLRLYRRGRTAKEIGQALRVFKRGMDEESVRRRLTIVRKQLGIPVIDKKTPKK